MPVIRLFFEKFNIPSEVYANGKVTLPKSWPLYSIFLNTNLCYIKQKKYPRY